MASHLRWTGHITLMNDSRLPEAVFYGELAKQKCLHGGQQLRYKDIVKRHLKATCIAWDIKAQHRQHQRKSHTEENISNKHQYDHNLCHGLPYASAPIVFCINCGRGFAAQIRSDQIRSDQIRSDQIRSDQIRSDQISHRRTKHMDETLH